MILNQVSAITLIIVFTVQSSTLIDLAIKKTLNQKERFNKQVKIKVDAFNDSHGNASIIAPLVITILMLKLAYAYSIYQRVNHQIEDVSNLLSCVKFQLHKRDKYIEHIELINKGIYLAQIGKQIPVVNIYGASTLEGLKVIQDVTHLNYLKDLVKSKYCTTLQSLKFKEILPFETTSYIRLMRTPDETTKRVFGKWKIEITGKRGLSKISIDGDQGDLKLQVSEGMQPLRVLFGQGLSLP